MRISGDAPKMSEWKGVAKNPSQSEVRKCIIQVFGTHLEVFSFSKVRSICENLGSSGLFVEQA